MERGVNIKHVDNSVLMTDTERKLQSHLDKVMNSKMKKRLSNVWPSA